jgi:excisionase family DNA binding protein
MSSSIPISDEFIEELAKRVAELNGARGPDQGFLNVEGAAHFLACPPSRIYSLVSAKRIPHHRDGSRLLFDRHELDAWVRAGGAKRP